MLSVLQGSLGMVVCTIEDIEHNDTQIQGVTINNDICVLSEYDVTCPR